MRAWLCLPHSHSIYSRLSRRLYKRGGEKSLFPQSTLILNMRGVFEEIPLMKNCGKTLERGRNYTWGRQIQFQTFRQITFSSHFVTAYFSSFQTFPSAM